jgi:hypothetical protein
MTISRSQQPSSSSSSSSGSSFVRDCRSSFVASELDSPSSALTPPTASERRYQTSPTRSSNLTPSSCPFLHPLSLGILVECGRAAATSNSFFNNTLLPAQYLPSSSILDTNSVGSFVDRIFIVWRISCIVGEEWECWSSGVGLGRKYERAVRGRGLWVNVDLEG